MNQNFAERTMEMKIGVSVYSFKDYNSKLGMDGVIAKVKEFGAEAVDFVDFIGFSENQAENIENAKKYKGYLEDNGLTAGAFCVGADFYCKNGGTLSDEIEKLKKKVDLAKILGCRVMRHDITGGVPAGIISKRSYDSGLPIFVKACREVTNYAAQNGIITCTENHGFFSQDSERVEKLINEVGDDNFGALVDIGNFLCADEEPEKAVGLLAQYAKHAHAKDFLFKKGDLDFPGEGWFCTRANHYLRGTIIGHGQVPVRQCLSILKKNGYDGIISIEFEGPEDALYGIRVGIENLKRFMI